MRKFLLFLFLAAFLAAGELTIKSWNLLHLSSKSLHKKDSSFISKYLSKNNYDVFVIQEVLDKKVLSELVKKRVLYSKKSGRKRYKEFIAFIISDKYRDSNLRVYTYYDSHDTFERDPAMLAVGKKFGVVGVHLIFGRKKGKGDGLTRREVRALANLVKYFSKKSGIPEEKIVIAGDFNLRASKIRLIVPSSLKVLIDKGTTVSTSKRRIAAHDYDHFVVHREVRVVRAFVDYGVLGGDKSVKRRKWFRKRVSDHYPLKIVLLYNND